MVPSSNERRNGRGDRCLLKTLSHYVGELRQLTGGAEYQYDKKITQNTNFCASVIPYGLLHTVSETWSFTIKVRKYMEKVFIMKSSLWLLFCFIAFALSIWIFFGGFLASPHHPLDVLYGSLIGLGASILSLRVYFIVRRKE